MTKKYAIALVAAVGVFSLKAQDLSDRVNLNQNDRPTAEEIQEKFNQFQSKKKTTRTATKAAEVFVEEDFEGEAIPASWTLEQAAGSEGWKADTADATKRWSPPSREDDLWYAVSSDSDADDGSNSNDASQDYLITPEVDLSNVSSAALKLDLYFDAEFALSTASIEASSDGMTWDEILTVTAATEWQNDVIVSLDNYTGMSNVQVRFVHNDGGGHASGFAIDNVSIEESVVELGLTLAFDVYSKLPAKQAYTVGFAGNVTNNGLETATGVALDASVTDPGANTTPLTPDALSATFEGQQTEDFNIQETTTQTELGQYTFDFELTSNEPDDSLGNNSINLLSEVTDTLFARDNGEMNGNAICGKSANIGLGVPVDLYPGNRYSFVAEDSITAVEFFFGSDASAGDEVKINLYPMAGGEPDLTTVLATTAVFSKSTPEGTSERVVAKIMGGVYEVSAQDTLFAAAELPGNAGLTVVGTDTTGITTAGASLIVVDAGFVTLNAAADPVGIRLVMGEFDPNSAQPDIVIDSVRSTAEYAFVPLNHAQELDFIIDIANVDAGAATDVTASVAVRSNGAAVYNNTVTVADIQGGGSATEIEVGQYTPDAIGTYEIIFELAATNESNTNNNGTSDTLRFVVSDSLYNRGNNDIAGNFPFGPNVEIGPQPDDLRLGSVYELLTLDTLTEATILLAGDQQQGDQLIMNIYDNGTPPFTAPVATSEIITIAANGTPGTVTPVTFNFPGGVALGSGFLYAELEAVSTTDDSQRTTYLASNYITPGRSFITTLGQDIDLIATRAAPIIELSFGTVTGGVGVEELAAQNVAVYPNPAQDQITITNAAGASYRLTGLDGKQVAAGSVVGNNFDIATAGLTKGVYLLQLEGTVNGTMKLVKQ